MGNYMAYLHELYTEKWACEQDQQVKQQEQQHDKKDCVVLREI